MTKLQNKEDQYSISCEQVSLLCPLSKWNQIRPPHTHTEKYSNRIGLFEKFEEEEKQLNTIFWNVFMDNIGIIFQWAWQAVTNAGEKTYQDWKTREFIRF